MNSPTRAASKPRSIPYVSILVTVDQIKFYPISRLSKSPRHGLEVVGADVSNDLPQAIYVQYSKRPYASVRTAFVMRFFVFTNNVNVLQAHQHIFHLPSLLIGEVSVPTSISNSVRLCPFPPKFPSPFLGRQLAFDNSPI